MSFRFLKILLLSAAFLATSVLTSSAALKVDYIYNLSSFQGVLPYSGARMFVDKGQDELYTITSDGIGIFNNFGMEVYNFGDDGSLGNVGGGAVDDKTGNILLLTSHYNYNKDTKTSTYETGLTLCNYRGEPISSVPLKDVPPEFSTFAPGSLVCRGNKVYLADTGAMKVLVVDWNGKYIDGYNIGNIMGLDEKKVRDSGLTGFNVDNDGNIYFTISVNFQAYKLTPDRKLTFFGQPGGSPGKFNIAAGIATDDDGNIYVVDTLKSAVQVFNKDFAFVTIFGGRGIGPGDLIAPNHITISKNMVYVSQSADRGVNVYRISNK
jgi:hypothetical protein